MDHYCIKFKDSRILYCLFHLIPCVFWWEIPICSASCRVTNLNYRKQNIKILKSFGIIKALNMNAMDLEQIVYDQVNRCNPYFNMILQLPR